MLRRCALTLLVALPALAQEDGGVAPADVDGGVTEPAPVRIG